MRLLFTYLACVFLGGMSVNVFAQDKVILKTTSIIVKSLRKIGLTILQKKNR